MTPRIKAAFLLFVSFGLGAILTLSPAAPIRVSTRDQCVNETLDMVLLVGAETRAQHPTWGQLEKEVARRLHIVRKQPWEKH